MTQFNTTSIKALITLTALVMINTVSFAKTFTAINSGKWSDAATWSAAGAPGNMIAADDEVVIANHITMNTDLTVSGTLTIETGKNVTSNKMLLITKAGKLVNNGNLVVMKGIINEGTINNNSMIESMNNVENKGTMTNNSNVMAGTNLMNMGGNVTGSKGTYFTNGSVLASADAKFGKDVKIYTEPTSATTTTSMSLEAKDMNGNVILTVNNPNGEEVKKFTIERSYNGQTYETVTNVQATNSAIAMIYQDKNVSQETVHYKVKVDESNYLPQATVRLANASASIR
jgi:hypothetical protein